VPVKRPLGRPSRRWKNNIKPDFKKITLKGVNLDSSGWKQKAVKLRVLIKCIISAQRA
jgi:hypothetical protein